MRKYKIIKIDYHDLEFLDCVSYKIGDAVEDIFFDIYDVPLDLDEESVLFIGL